MNRRTRRNAARFLGLGLFAVGLALVAGIGAASADGPGATLDAKGWWWQANDGHLPTPLPPPPNVQPGQLEIQSAPSNDRGAAFAAVRFTIDADHTGQVLKLNVADNGDSGAPAVLLACRTGSAWKPADAGQWNAAPSVNTNACVNGTKAADGKSWSFPVGTLQVATVLDIAIIPGVDPQTNQRTPFSITFNEPHSDALATTSQPPPTVPPATSTFTPSNFTPSLGSTGSTYTTPSLPPVPTALPPDKLGETATSPAKQAASQQNLQNAVDIAAPAKDRDKRIGFVVLLVAAGVGLYAWRQDSLLAMNGGKLPGESDEPAGLGRFSKPRQGQPPALT